MNYAKRVPLKTRPRTRAMAVAACVVAAAALATPGLALGAGATGNAKAIAYYRVAVSTTNHLKSYEISQTGYVRIYSTVGKVNVSRWVWGNQQFQPGYYATNEKIEVAQRAGRVIWYEDTLRPIVPRCRSKLCIAIYPIQFYITRTAAYEGIITRGTNASCFYKEQFANVPYRAGSAYWVTYGYFYPMSTTGGLTRITSKYSNGAQKVTETDTINRTTKIFTASTYHFAAAGRYRAYAYKARYSPLKSTPKPPTISIC